jgi:hypothetical protein
MESLGLGRGEVAIDDERTKAGNTDLTTVRVTGEDEWERVSAHTIDDA